MSGSLSEQPPLFGVDQPPVRKAAVAPAQDKVRWGPINIVNPPVCDVCAQAYLQDPSAPLGRRAKYKRVAGPREQWLCHWHANDQREIDRLPTYK